MRKNETRSETDIAIRAALSLRLGVPVQEFRALPIQKTPSGVQPKNMLGQKGFIATERPTGGREGIEGCAERELGCISSYSFGIRKSDIIAKSARVRALTFLRA